MRSRARAAGCVLAAALAASACSPGAGTTPESTGRISTEIVGATPTSTPSPPRAPEVGGAADGALLGIEGITDISPEIAELGASTYRMLFRSTGAAGEPRLSSGVLVVPGGQPPDDGWPVIALGHGTTGVREECAPSAEPDLRGHAPTVADIVARGYAVVMPDYQGLGVPDSYHPYLDSRVLGANMIDAVRAARHADGRLGRRWGAIGGSLGGQAAWAAADLAPTYGRGLELVGAAAAAPTADMAGLADRAYRGELTDDQRMVYVYAVDGLARTHPGTDLDDYRSSRARRSWSLLLRCDRDAVTRQRALMRRLGPEDLAPRSPQARDRLRDALRATALPSAVSDVPVLVLYGSADEVVDAAWTARALARACAVDAPVEYQRREGEGHQLDGTAMLPWLQARFDGQAPLDSCDVAR